MLNINYGDPHSLISVNRQLKHVKTKQINFLNSIVLLAIHTTVHYEKCQSIISSPVMPLMNIR